MATVEKTQAEYTLTLTLSQPEAEALFSLLSASNGTNSPGNAQNYAIYMALSQAKVAQPFKMSVDAGGVPGLVKR